MPYDIAALEAAIERARVNIQTFENAIARERQTIAEYYGLIEAERRRLANPPQVAVEVEVVDDDED